MADVNYPLGDGTNFVKYKDMGDGTKAAVVSVSDDIASDVPSYTNGLMTSRLQTSVSGKTRTITYSYTNGQYAGATTSAWA